MSSCIKGTSHRVTEHDWLKAVKSNTNQLSKKEVPDEPIRRVRFSFKQHLHWDSGPAVQSHFQEARTRIDIFSIASICCINTIHQEADPIFYNLGLLSIVPKSKPCLLQNGVEIT